MTTKIILIIFRLVCLIPLVNFIILLGCFFLYEFFALYHQQKYTDLIGYAGPLFSLCLSPLWLILTLILLYYKSERKPILLYSIIVMIPV